MKESEIRERAFAMPLTSPAYPPAPTGSCIANT
jgi:acetoacetate decarboxylase